MRSQIILMLCLILLSFAANADQLIIEPDEGRKPLIKLMSQSQSSLYLVMYGLTDHTLLQTLLQQKRLGKNIQILLERAPYKALYENTRSFAKLNAAKINWQDTIPTLHFIHEKMLLIDEKKALIMTFNLTKSTFKNERNFALLIDDRKRVKEIAAIFAADWQHHPTRLRSTQVIVSPDNSRDQLLSQIHQAEFNLQIYAQQMNDYRIIGALAQAAKKGVKVQILTSTTLPEKLAHYLNRAGVIIHYSKKMFIHAKVMIIDQRAAVVGSINLTQASLDDNRELSVLTFDKEVIHQLITTFNKDWQAE